MKIVNAFNGACAVLCFCGFLFSLHNNNFVGVIVNAFTTSFNVFCALYSREN